MSLHVTSTGSIAAQLIDPTDSVILRASNAATMAGVNPEGRIVLPTVRTSTAWAVRDVLAEPGTVGAKASNLVALASALPEWIHVCEMLCLFVLCCLTTRMPSMPCVCPHCMTGAGVCVPSLWHL